MQLNYEQIFLTPFNTYLTGSVLVGLPYIDKKPSYQPDLVDIKFC